jgi:hypothetical protein
MINHPVFFARNVKAYLRLEQVLVQADDNARDTAGRPYRRRLEPRS